MVDLESPFIWKTNDHFVVLLFYLRNESFVLRNESFLLESKTTYPFLVHRAEEFDSGIAESKCNR